MSTPIQNADRVIRCCPRCGGDLPDAAATCPACGNVLQTDAGPALPAAAPVSSEQMLYAHAAAVRMMESNATPQQVIDQLASQHLDRTAATALYNTLAATRYQTERTTARRTMLDGLLWAIAGIAVTLITRLIAEERGGTYFIFWGPALFGGLQFVRSLSQFLRNRAPQSLVGTVVADTNLIARGYVWPRPALNLKATLGSVAFLALFVVISLLGRGDPLIDQAAADLNLSVADLGPGFSLTEESGPDAAEDKDIRDVNTRDLAAEGVFIRSAVMVGKKNFSDTPAELIAVLEKSMQQETSVVAKFDKSQTISIGDRGGIESFTLTGLSGSLHGYMVTFVKRNVIVLLIEMGSGEQVTKDSVQKHARLIANRLP